ncbi:MAG: CRISPR-associated endonuclease Cas2 [Acidilobaceae archaeon]
MRYVIVYDISDDGKRLKVAKVLEQWGLARIQRSAFTGSLQASRVRDLARRLELIIDVDSDVVHIIPVQPQDWAKVIVLGKPYWVAGRVEGVELLP